MVWWLGVASEIVATHRLTTGSVARLIASGRCMSDARGDTCAAVHVSDPPVSNPRASTESVVRATRSDRRPDHSSREAGASVGAVPGVLAQPIMV